MSYDKFTFKIKTKAGTTIDQVTIGANGRAEAESRLLRMYNDCQVLDCQTRHGQENSAKSPSAQSELPTYEQMLGRLLS